MKKNKPRGKKRKATGGSRHPNAAASTAATGTLLDSNTNSDDDNEDVILLGEKFFALNTEGFEPAPENLDKIRAVHANQDPSVAKALCEGVTGWLDVDHVITFEGRFYIPKSTPLRNEIIRNHHDAPAAGHPGHHKTLELVS